MIPPLIPMPKGASMEVRRQMYRDAVEELVRYNPRHFLPPTVKKRWWHFGRIQYPEVLL